MTYNFPNDGGGASNPATSEYTLEIEVCAAWEIPGVGSI